MIPHKLIFIKPEKNEDIIIQEQLVDEIITVFEKLDSEYKIHFVKEKSWIKYRHLIEDFSNTENLSNFFLTTGVTGITSCGLEKHLDRILCKFYFFNIRENKIRTVTYDILQSQIINNSKDFLDYIEKIILANYQNIDINIIRKEKIKFRILNRKDPFYELFFSGGSGYATRQSFEGGIYSSGINFYFLLSQKFKYFNLDIIGSISLLFNEEISGYTFLHDAFGSFVFGGWLIKQTFKFGAGFTINPSAFYIERRYYDNYREIIKVSKLDAILTFFYLNFSIKPTSSFLLNLNIGSFFSINYFTEITPFPSFPVYTEFSMRYNISKKFYFEFIVPFYMVGYKSENYDDDHDKNIFEQYSPSFTGMIKCGLGWHFEKDKE
ncbi:MAG: hypothetical protein JXB50_14590 [Spirochaetes bacterium]|nr:hypothetical protein [Spirochaetota bacterium]